MPAVTTLTILFVPMLHVAVQRPGEERWLRRRGRVVALV
jgi:hypothetical protein